MPWPPPPIAPSTIVAWRKYVFGPQTRILGNVCATTAWFRLTERLSRYATPRGVREKFGVEPALIPDFLALVGDAADGYPGIKGIGRVSACKLLERYGPLERFPPEVLGERKRLALLFKTLATLRTDVRVFSDVDELRWEGPTSAFLACAMRIADRNVLDRAMKAVRNTGG
jgi:5'-3' exonuclease